MYPCRLAASLFFIASFALPRLAIAQDVPTGDVTSPEVVTASETVTDEVAPSVPARDVVQTPDPVAAIPDVPVPSDGPDVELPPEDGPLLELPPEGETGLGVAQPSPTDFDSAIDRIFIGAGSSVTIAGYGEVHYTVTSPESGEATNEIDVHRMVLYVGKQFSDQISFGAEIEIEHAIAGEGKVGEIEIEQAIVDYRLTDQDHSLGEFGLRAGVMLVPMGIVNQWHEPPLFHGVERPSVDRVVIPSTWREGGIGIYHKPTETLSYEAYVMGGLNPLGFSGDAGVRRGRQMVGLARTDGHAFAGRAQYEPNAQTVLGLSGYYNEAGHNTDAVDADVTVIGVALDARSKFKGIEAKAEFAMFTIGDTDALNAVPDEAGGPLTDVGDRQLGFYTELAYDVLYTSDTEKQLLPFARFEYFDTHPDEDTLTAIDLVAGLTFRPIPQVVFKGDVTYRRADGQVIGDNATLYNLGVGFLF